MAQKAPKPPAEGLEALKEHPFLKLLEALEGNSPEALLRTAVMGYQTALLPFPSRTLDQSGVKEGTQSAIVAALLSDARSHESNVQTADQHIDLQNKILTYRVGCQRIQSHVLSVLKGNNAFSNAYLNHLCDTYALPRREYKGELLAQHVVLQDGGFDISRETFCEQGRDYRKKFLAAHGIQATLEPPAPKPTSPPPPPEDTTTGEYRADNPLSVALWHVLNRHQRFVRGAGGLVVLGQGENFTSNIVKYGALPEGETTLVDNLKAFCVAIKPTEAETLLITRAMQATRNQGITQAEKDEVIALAKDIANWSPLGMPGDMPGKSPHTTHQLLKTLQANADNAPEPPLENTASAIVSCLMAMTPDAVTEEHGTTLNEVKSGEYWKKMRATNKKDDRKPLENKLFHAFEALTEAAQENKKIPEFADLGRVTDFLLDSIGELCQGPSESVSTAKAATSANPKRAKQTPDGL